MMMIFLWNLAVDMLWVVMVVWAALLRVRCMGPQEVTSSLKNSNCPAASDRDQYRYMLAGSDDEEGCC